MFLKQTFFIGVLSFVFAFNLSAQTYIGKQKDIDKILKKVAAFSKYVVAGDAEAIAASYTADGKIFPNKKDILEGTAALQEYWKPREGWKTTYHKVTPQEIRIVKKTAYDYGYYEGESQSPDGTKSQWKGKYVIVWKKVKKDWKIYLDIWNGM